MNENSETVYLSDLKFASIIPNSQSSPSPNPTTVTADQNPARSNSNLPSSGFSRPKPLERLAADKIGEELAPDAGIWQLYVDEAKEHDDELVDCKNKNLDMMLLFAALFSAILTAFLMASTNLLQQNPAEVSMGLLLLMAQSQQRLEQGTPRRISAPIQLPEFSVPMSARWINGLWFLSLAFSLSAALVAMLAKEWLTAYNTSRPRSAHTYTLERQARFVGLNRWRALHIIDILPSMLHLALLQFSFGLILYLSTLDSAIAAVIGVITGGTFLFYVATTSCGAIYEFCPFITQISTYVRKGLLFCAKICKIQTENLSKKDKHPDDDTTDEDLHALIWLAEHARDPAVGDCSYQALAGLRLRLPKRSAQNSLDDLKDKETTAEAGVTIDGDASALMTSQSLDAPSNQNVLVYRLFSSLCARLSQVSIQQPRELAACQGINAARYANALPKLVDFLQANWGQQLVSKDTVEINNKLMSEIPAQTAFDALDTIWRNECPALGPDSYTLLTAAELRLTMSAASPPLRQGPPQDIIADTPVPESPLPISTLPERENGLSQTDVVIIMDSSQKPSESSGVPLFELRARYSRALSRAGYLLSLHADGRVPIGADALINMLNSISEAAGCDPLNPESQLSTHQSQSQGGPAPEINLRVIGLGEHFYVNPDTIGDEDGLLAGLLELTASADVKINPGLGDAAEAALNAVSPILLQQWLNMSEPKAENAETLVASGSKLTPTTWSRLTDHIFRGWETDRAAWQALAIAIIAVPHAGQSGIDELPERAIHTLYRRLKTDSSRGRAHNTFRAQQDRMAELISLVDQHIPKLNQATLKYLINIPLIGCQNANLFQQVGISVNRLPAFLRILSKVPDHVSELQKLLTVLEHKVQTDIRYLGQFTDAEGECVAGIIRGAVMRDRYVTTGALLRFLDSVSFALGALRSDKEGTAALLASACNVKLSSHYVPDGTTHLISIHAAFTAIHNSLKALREPSKRQMDLLAQLEEIQARSSGGGMPLRESTSLLEQDLQE